MNNNPYLKQYNPGGKVIIDGKEVSTSSQEYKDLYDAGVLMGVDYEGLPNMYAPEVEVTAEAPLWLKQKRQQEQAEYTDEELERYMYQGKKPERDKDFILPPGERLNIYNSVVPYEYPHSEFPKALKRYINGEERPYFGQSSVIEKDRDLGKVDEDAWAQFMGLPQLYNTVQKSEYLPTNSKDKNAEYYTIRKGYPDFDELLLESAHNWFQRKENSNATTLKGVGSPFMPLENVTYSKGQDEKGKYYSMYDIYDFNVPYQKGIGKPYDIYDRVYYDDSNPDKPTLLKNKYGGQNPYITPKYTNGGPIDPVDPEDEEAAMRGMMKARIAIDSHFGNPAAKRLTAPYVNPYVFSGNEKYDGLELGVPSGSTGTHFMSSMGRYAVPFIQQNKEGNLYYNENASPSDAEAMKFETEKEAEYFANENYKKVAPLMKNWGKFKSGGDTESIVEIERSERVYTPDGKLIMETPADAPTHEEGGVKVKLKPGSLVFPLKYFKALDAASGLPEFKKIADTMLDNAEKAYLSGEPYSSGGKRNKERTYNA